MKKATIPERIEAIKEAFGIKNDSELARRIGVDPAYISRFKAGVQSISAKAVERFLSHIPGLSESFIRDGVGDPIDPARQAEIDREALIAMILRNFRRLEPGAQALILESARRLAELEEGGKKESPESEERGDDRPEAPPAPSVRAG